MTYSKLQYSTTTVRVHTKLFSPCKWAWLRYECTTTCVLICRQSGNQSYKQQARHPPFTDRRVDISLLIEDESPTKGPCAGSRFLATTTIIEIEAATSHGRRNVLQPSKSIARTKRYGPQQRLEFHVRMMKTTKSLWWFASPLAFDA